MKTYCQKCDYPNDLGHMFCIKCGAKLVLESIREDIEMDGMLERTKGRFLYVLLVLVVVLAAVLIFCFWPYKPFESSSPVSGNLDVVDVSIARLQAVAESSKTPFTNTPLKEEDINAWLAREIERIGAKSVTVKLKPDSCTMRVISQAGPWSVFGSDRKVGPITYSRDFTGGVTSNGLVVTGAKIGHLPMFGPLTRLVAKRSADNFSSFTKEATIMSQVTSIKVEEGQISLVVMSRP